jgi:hypothetical protein
MFAGKQLDFESVFLLQASNGERPAKTDKIDDDYA